MSYAAQIATAYVSNIGNFVEVDKLPQVLRTVASTLQDLAGNSPTVLGKGDGRRSASSTSPRRKPVVLTEDTIQCLECGMRIMGSGPISCYP